MKALQTIQTLCKIGKILCGIVFICCLVGGIGCAIGIAFLVLIPSDFSLFGNTFAGFLAENEVTLGNVYANMAVGAVLCFAECIESKTAGKYFTNERKAGTPFTEKGADQLKRTGIVIIVTSLIGAALAYAVKWVVSFFFGNVGDVQIESSFSAVGIGIAFWIISLLCRAGVEKKEVKEEYLPWQK